MPRAAAAAARRRRRARRAGGRGRRDRRGRAAALPDGHDAARDGRAASARARGAAASAGIAVVTVRSHDAGLLTGVKATSYATALAAIAEAETRGADDAIYLGEGETVLEATMSNIWWREDDVLVTPSLSTGVLPGVTRGAVAALARRAGYRIREGSFTLPALLRAEEAFTSSAVREIMPVVAVDGRELPRGEAAREAPGAARAGDRRVP